MHYDHCDSYPDVLGLEMLQSMRSPGAITEKRQKFKGILDKWSGSPDSQPWEDDFTISSQRPQTQTNLFMEWIYEIDLDRNIFHINCIPFFNLEYLPDGDTFLKCIYTEETTHHDNYGNISCAPRCLPEHKYKRPGPPVVDDSDLVTYQSSVCTGTHVALSDMLAISDVLSPNEQVRVSLLELMIGQCMTGPECVRPSIGQLIFDFELIPNHNQLTDEEWSGACSLASLPFVPQLFDGPYDFIHHPRLRRKEFTWVRGDTIVLIATHLDDERCLQAAISRLIAAILEQKDVPGDYFGIAFSMYHCAIVKVVNDAQTTTFSHTAVLQFLPSFDAESPSTPGITALARLGYRTDPALFVRAMEACRWRPGMDKWLAGEAPSVNCAVLPPELWLEIAFHLELQDVLTLGLVSKLCRGAASTALRYPHVLGHRLVAVSKENPEGMLQNHHFLRAASFSAARAVIPAIVHLGWGGDDAAVIKIPLDTANTLKGCSPSVCVPISGTVRHHQEKNRRRGPTHEFADMVY
ncbi:hypothetical protein DFH29DRAFT_998535 [Suillus ampliporus]|nr:hypothetical protein DFH29DRAFT_998535 [Suillus ampliporus]